MGFIAEGFVFAYLGLTFFSYKSFEWSYELIYVEFVIILIGRGVGTFGLIGFLKLFGYEKANKRRVTCSELLFIWYAGLIRGAIAFGLVLRISGDVINRSVIVTTCLSLVVFTTVFFGSTVGLLGKCLFDKTPEVGADDNEVEEEVEIPSYEVSVGSDLSSKSVSELHAPLIHHNAKEEADTSSSEEEEKKKKKKKNPTCVDYLRRFDELIMRPVFIYHYEKDMVNRAREFYDLFMHDGDKIEKQYEHAAEQQRMEDRSHSQMKGGES